MSYVQSHGNILDEDGIESTVSVVGVSLAKLKGELYQSALTDRHQSVERAVSSQTSPVTPPKEAKYVVGEIIGNNRPTDRRIHRAMVSVSAGVQYYGTSAPHAETFYHTTLATQSSLKSAVLGLSTETSPVSSRCTSYSNVPVTFIPIDTLHFSIKRTSPAELTHTRFGTNDRNHLLLTEGGAGRFGNVLGSEFLRTKPSPVAALLLDTRPDHFYSDHHVFIKTDMTNIVNSSRKEGCRPSTR